MHRRGVAHAEKSAGTEKKSFGEKMKDFFEKTIK